MGGSPRPHQLGPLIQRKLAYVNDGVPAETTHLISSACAQRNVEFVEVYAPAFDFRPARRLPPGDLLFRPATSIAAIRVEQFLAGDGVGTLYALSAATRVEDGPAISTCSSSRRISRITRWPLQRPTK